MELLFVNQEATMLIVLDTSSWNVQVFQGDHWSGADWNNGAWSATRWSPDELMRFGWELVGSI